MSKQCPVCETINHSAANHCSKCGVELPDKELSEEDKLRIELHEANTTIQGLNVALEEMRKFKNTSEKAQKIVADYKLKLNEKQREISTYSNTLSEKDRKISILTKQLESIKNSRNKWVSILLIACLILGISSIGLADYYVQNKTNAKAQDSTEISKSANLNRHISKRKKHAKSKKNNVNNSQDKESSNADAYIECKICEGKGFTYSKENCSICKGTGTSDCSKCGGTGSIVGAETNWMKATCPVCLGKGKSICKTCNGSGKINEEVKCSICNGIGKSKL
ncbi:DnaJ central domain protein [Paludibacter propionicigenes WB4]|uniref:DnaJ central domain protein n=1 Tax=Paludibacter propionicigenes (strain DSM 17365 / JCM 13257 / WB4) TaxID=694427 RepID=E4T632_PALPW|nr:dnaj central domain-containing protein [Paludibacter propionicigenes]ADQ80176.1 DnaJ central domain protein [Paludibacter propionicigenes WB4]